MFASTLGVMLAMGIILTVLISMTIGYIATVGSTPDYTPKSNTVFKIKLDGTLADNPAENPFSAHQGGEWILRLDGRQGKHAVTEGPARDDPDSETE